MKIPTLLALALLSIIVIIAISSKFYLDKLPFFNPTTPEAEGITLSNLTSDSQTISFTTVTPTAAQVIYSPDKNLISNTKIAIDERNTSLSKRNFHFITLRELSPNMVYYFKIKVGTNFGKPLVFTTPSILNPTDNLDIQPLVGTVVDPNLNPVSEALVMLKVEGFLPLSTYTDTNGGFVLALKPLYGQNNLTQILPLPANQDARLIINKNKTSSQVEIKLNQIKKALPSIILGQNLDLRDYIAPDENIASTSSRPAELE